MIFIDQYDSSILKKSLFSSFIIVVNSVSLLLMFVDSATSNLWLHQYQLDGDIMRRILIAFCLIIYCIRLMITVWIFQKRKWTWLESIIITVLMSFALFAFAFFGGNNKQSLSFVEIIGILLYLSGSYLNTYSECSRHVWKSKKENKGRLYSKGLFRLSMHINYFGDIVLFTGLALITHLGLLVIPLIMGLNFIFNIIPSLDSYLEKKYKDEFIAYSKKTKKFIPLVY